MRIIALDLSVKSTGFALWEEGAAGPTAGTWALAPGLDYADRAFVRLHRNLGDLSKLGKFNWIVFENPLQASQLHGHTNVDTMEAAIGLASHAKSFAIATGAAWKGVDLATWRRHFIGKMPRGTKSPDLKQMAMVRCRELGFNPAKHDAAEAIGLLDYQLHVMGIQPPWRLGRVFEDQLVPGASR